MNKKYIFETNFDDPGQKVPDKNVDEIFASGRKAGIDEAMQSIERQTGEICHAVLKHLQHIVANFQRIETNMVHKSTALVLYTLQKLLPASFAKQGSEEITSAVRRCLEISLQMPKLTVKVSPDMIASIEPKLMDIAQQCGFSGQLLISPEPSLGIADCRIEWGNGGMEHLPSDAWKTIESILQQAVPPEMIAAIPAVPTETTPS